MAIFIHYDQTEKNDVIFHFKYLFDTFSLLEKYNLSTWLTPHKIIAFN